MTRPSSMVLVVALAITASAITTATEPRPVLYIQPLGQDLPEEDSALALFALKEFYGLPVVLLPRVDLPREAYFPPRQRYRADRLLDFLRTRLPEDGLRILGLTAVDISTTKGRYYDWGVLGLATLDGTAGVISSFRCRKKARGGRHARERLAKVAVHEIGHTLGLDHCPQVGCIMEDARGQVATTDREYDLCARCRAKLQALGRGIPAQPRIPWPRP